MDTSRSELPSLVYFIVLCSAGGGRAAGGGGGAMGCALHVARRYTAFALPRRSDPISATCVCCSALRAPGGGRLYR